MSGFVFKGQPIAPSLAQGMVRRLAWLLFLLPFASWAQSDAKPPAGKGKSAKSAPKSAQEPQQKTEAGPQTSEGAADALGLPTRQVARYLCSNGESLALTRKFTKAELAGLVSQSAISAQDATTKRNVKMVQDAAQSNDGGREVINEYQLQYKYRMHTLKLDRTTHGIEYVDRTWGLAWQEKANRGTLRNIHSGRILARECRPGIAAAIAPEEGSNAANDGTARAATPGSTPAPAAAR